jgi:hypothetical protein
VKRFALPGLLLAFVLLDLWLLADWLPHKLVDDEWRYEHYAKNLTQGFFSPRDRVFLFNGPGYPLMLVPFVARDWLDGGRYLNVALHCGALAYAWGILRPRLRLGWTVLAVALLGLYPPLLRHVPLVMTEVASFFLVTAFMYHALHVQDARWHRVAAGVYLGILCLTKVIFGYVAVLFLVAALGLWVHERRSIWRDYALAGALGLFVCLPFLVYTHDLTGRWFYWSSGGPNSFYWLASPYDGEVGDWYHDGWVRKNKLLRKHHLRVFDHITGVDENPNLPPEEQLFNESTPEASDYLMKVALKNVRKRPGKFVRNWLMNIPRMFTDLPVSVRKVPFLVALRPQQAKAHKSALAACLPPSSVPPGSCTWNPYAASSLVLFAVTAGVAVWTRRTWRWPARPWWAILGFMAFTFGFYSMSSAVARYLVPILPLWWIALCAWAGSRAPGARPSAPQELAP